MARRDSCKTDRSTSRMLSIVDSHCHAWKRWPYKPDVPDPESRGTVAQLLFEMDTHGVDQAVIVSAAIGDNPDNNADVAEQVAAHPDRLHQFADVDSVWSASHRTPGADKRLRAVAERWPIQGFTHYLSSTEDAAWFDSSVGREFFGVGAELGLIASLSLHPGQHTWIRKVAARYPSLMILIHHLGHINADEGADGESVRELVTSAEYPNLSVKFSGFRYLTKAPAWDFPYCKTHDAVRRVYDAYGPRRMCWGSDYPVVQSSMTYRQSLEAVRSHCQFIAAADMPGVLGGNLKRLLAGARFRIAS